MYHALYTSQLNIAIEECIYLNGRLYPVLQSLNIFL